MKTGFITLFSLAILAGCISTDYDPYVTAVENQLETRSYQTREFNDAGYKQLLIAVIGTLQDYHFRILEVNAELGIVTAYQMTGYDQRTQL